MTTELNRLKSELRDQQSKLSFVDCDPFGTDFHEKRIAAIKRKITRLKKPAKKLKAVKP